MDETTASSVKSSYKRCFQEFSSELELMEHLQGTFKYIINDTQCIVCKRYFKVDCGLSQHLIWSKRQSVLLK